MHKDLAEIWSLEQGGTTVSAASVGVTEIVRRRASARTETCVLRMDGAAFDGPPLFAEGSTIAVRRDGVLWFVGRLTAVAGSGDGNAEGVDHVLCGPWWYLENLVCRQVWTLDGGTSRGPLSRLVLGQAADGSRLTSGQVITETLQYAIDAGAPMQIGVVEPETVLPLEELLNVTCAQVIRRVLRWHPDCVAWFDHRTAPVPTFHCRARFSLPAALLTLGEAPLAAVRGIAARPELVAPAVVLHYETLDGKSHGVLTDAAPPDATGQEPGALVFTLPTLQSGVKEDGAEAHFSRVESLPTGADGQSLAQALFDARQALPYSGSVVLKEPEAGASVPAPGEDGGIVPGLGCSLNLLGSARTDWANMRALVIGDETRVASGTTTVRFGPAAGEGEGEGSGEWRVASGEWAAGESGGLAAALRAVQPGVAGRVEGSPAVTATRAGMTRVSGKAEG